MPDIDLWPEELGSATVTASPKSILQEQAQRLTDKTSRKLRGRVETRPSSQGFSVTATRRYTHSDFRHVFSILVPALEDYEYELLAIYSNAAAIYPVYGEFNDEIKELVNEEQLVDWLRSALSTSRAKQVVNSLLAQAA